jgi:hypothetical protein
VKPTNTKISEMQRSKRQKQETVITITCSPTDLTKKGKLQVLSSVCALLNSNGGELIIAFPDQTYQTKYLDPPVRVVEQWINNLIGTVMMSKNVELKVAPHQILIIVKGSYSLITVDYKMFLPSHTQVNRVLPVEKLEEIQDVLFGEEMMTCSNELPAVQQLFVQGEEIKLTETYSVQFKQLEDAPTKCTTLADRVVGKGNKLIQYISAFANYRGGAIYVGVDDKQHIINGEVIPPNERESIRKKVTSKINKMIWLELEDEPRRGENWDIYFHPVRDKEGRPVESTFVIVIVVSRCPGGVFVEEPESYHFANGYVEKMKLSTWKQYLLSKRSRNETDAVHSTLSAESRSALQMQCQRPIGRSQWSSIRNRKRYDYVNGVLIRMINDGSWKEFWARAKMEDANCLEGGIRLVVLLMKTTAHYKQANFEQAQLSMEEYRRTLSQSEDRLISETRLFLLRSSVERCKGNIRESYKHAKNGLRLAEQIPAGIVAGEFYANIATVITILLKLENNIENKKILKEKGIFFFQKAIEHLDHANDYLPSKFDQKQKVHINLAFLYLGCSFASDARAEKRVEDAAIEKAVNSLSAVDKCVNEGYALSDYRDCQYLLARSVLFYRLSQNLKADEAERRAQLLKSALKFSSEAKEKAIDSEFAEMLECTSKHMDFFNSPSDCDITEHEKHCQ